MIPAMLDKFWLWLAYRLPRRLVYWCAIRVHAHAGHARPFNSTNRLTPADCLKAWEE